MRHFPAHPFGLPRDNPIVPEARLTKVLFLLCSKRPSRLFCVCRTRRGGWSMTRVVLRVALLALLLTPRAATAQDPRQNTPGQFDFYILSLSWSPSFCAGAAERGARNANVQCGPRPYSFVVHGLWPQYDKGFPEYCQIPAPRLDRGVVSSM